MTQKAEKLSHRGKYDMTNVQIRNWQISLIKDNHATIDSAQSYSHDGIMCINHLWLLFFCEA